MVKDQTQNECIYVLAGGRPNIWGVLARNPGRRDSDIRVVSDKTSIEVGSTKERLGLLDFPGCRSIPHDFYLRFVHLKAVRAYNEAY